MHFFRREIEVALETIGIIVLLMLIVFPLGWGYEQRQKARTWQNLACTYRIKEAERRTPMLANVDSTRGPCEALQRLGLELEVVR
jgi:hypothetical protein